MWLKLYCKIDSCNYAKLSLYKYLNKMNFELTGTLIQKLDTQVISDRFKKREFAIEMKDLNATTGVSYSNFAKFQLTQAKCDNIDGYQLGDEIKVSFNIRGTRYEKNGATNYISNLEAWRIQKADASAAGATATPVPVQNNVPDFIQDTMPPFTPDSEAINDLPF